MDFPVPEEKGCAKGDSYNPYYLPLSIFSSCFSCSTTHASGLPDLIDSYREGGFAYSRGPRAMGSPRMDNAACPIDPGGRHIVVEDHAPSSESETRIPPGRSHGTSSMSHRPAQEAIQLPESDEDWDMFISR